MYVTPDGINIEVKARKLPVAAGDSGFCRPCVRMVGAKTHIENRLGLVITETLVNPEGEVYFFHDREGILWHAKDYAHRDQFINW
jgi:hypothetical protein